MLPHKDLPKYADVGLTIYMKALSLFIFNLRSVDYFTACIGQVITIKWRVKETGFYDIV